MKPLRVINIRYLNSIPFRSLSRDPSIEYREGLPAECAAALLQRDVDLALLPLASILKHGFYKMLPYGNAADGPVESVFLFSERKIEDLKSIALDASSETSVLLLKTLLAEFYPETYKNLQFKVQGPERVLTAIGGDVGGFVIGDTAFANSSRYPFVLDLAETWKEKTSLPFLFSCWCYRPGELSREQLELFLNHVKRGLALRELFARDWAETLGVNRESAMRYVGQVIKFEVTPRVVEGVREFVQRAARHNFLPTDFLSEGQRSFEYDDPADNASKRVRPPMSVASAEALSERRLSVAAAMNLVERASVAELAAIIHLRKQLRRKRFANVTKLIRLCLTGRPGRDQRTGHDASASTVISRETLQGVLRNLPPRGILLLESERHDELALEYFEELIRWISSESRIEVGALSIADLLYFAKEEHLSIEETVGRLIRSGLTLLGGRTAKLLHGGAGLEPLEYIAIQRTVTELGLRTVTNLPINVNQSLEEWGVHLFHIRQLQDQTGSVDAHFIEAALPINRTYRENESVTAFAKAVALSELIVDNVATIAVSPLGYGAPVAEVLVELGADQTMLEL